MNIFALHPVPETSALWLDDKRKNKMITETAQMISTVIWRNHSEYYRSHQSVLMQPSYVNHPCTKWAAAHINHLYWLHEYLQSLKTQWGKPHKSFRVLPIVEPLVQNPVTSILSFPNCTTYKHIEDTVQAYRIYMVDKWNKDLLPTWNKGEKPYWYEEKQ